MKDSQQKSLDARLGDLRLDVAPPRNLWPGIAARLPRRPRRARPLAWAAAAALVGASVAGALTWAVMHGRSGVALPQTAVRAAAFAEPRSPGYVAARDALEVNFRRQLAVLDPATRARIEASLEVIRHAHEDIRKALASDPSNPVLEQLWQSTWHDELDLYDRVVRATQPTLRT